MLYALRTAHYALRTAHCALLTVHYSLRTTYHWLLTTDYVLLTIYYLLMTWYLLFLYAKAFLYVHSVAMKHVSRGAKMEVWSRMVWAEGWRGWASTMVCCPSPSCIATNARAVATAQPLLKEN